MLTTQIRLLLALEMLENLRDSNTSCETQYYNLSQAQKIVLDNSFDIVGRVYSMT